MSGSSLAICTLKNVETVINNHKNTGTLSFYKNHYEYRGQYDRRVLEYDIRIQHRKGSERHRKASERFVLRGEARENYGCWIRGKTCSLGYCTGRQIRLNARKSISDEENYEHS